MEGVPVRASNGYPVRGGKLKFPPYAGKLVPVMNLVIPPMEWVKAAHAGDMTKEQFGTEYQKIIRGSIDLIELEEATLRKKEQVPDGVPLVLLCFCRLGEKGNWCHRTMFASVWQELHPDDTVPELGKVRAAEIAAQQTDLFQP